MPIYAYRCTHCGHSKDVLQKISDPVLTDCPVCGKPSFSKQVTAAGFQLKGSGWYATDFKGAAAASAAGPAVASDTGGASSAPSTDSAASKASAVATTTDKASTASAACSTGCACH
jgi:putative FmdB family regulatory protein